MPASAGARTRVLFVLDNFQVGGTEMNAVRTAERLDRQSVDLRVVAFQRDGPLLERYHRAGIPVRYLPIRSLHHPGTVMAGLQLARLIRRERIQIVHAHDRYSNIVAAPFARLRTRAAVIASRRWWTATPRPGMSAANRLAYRFAHRVLANSPAVGALLADTEGVPASRIVVIPNFVDESAFDPPSDLFVRRMRDELGIPADAPVVGIVANLTPVKNHRLLLAAIARIAPRWPALRVVLVGDGNCRSLLAAQAEALGIAGQVIFAGTHPHQPSLHHLFDVSVLTSVSEGFPNSIVEAMAAGRPVVATAVGGVVDALEGGTGVLVPSEHVAQLAEEIDALLSDPARRRALGEAARARAVSHYSAARVIGQLEQLYDSLAARP